MSKSGSGDNVASVEETNAMRKKLGLKPLDTGKTTEAVGHSKNPVDALAEKSKPKKDSASDVKKRSAASKNKQEHEEFTSGASIADIIEKEEGKGGAADWIARSRNTDGSMKAKKTEEAASAADTKRRKTAKGDDKADGLKVRHDQSQIIEGTEVTMVLSDQPLLNKDGELINSKDELSNVRMIDEERYKHNEAVKNQVEYDPHKDNQDILEKYNDLKTGPTGFVLGGSHPAGKIDEQDPEKRLALLTALSERDSAETKLKLQSDFYTTEEMNKMLGSRKAPKKKTKRKKEATKEDKEDQIGGALPSGTAAAGRPADAGSDEEDPELYEQLSKQRRLVRRSDAGSVKKGEAALGAVSERINSVDNSEEVVQEKERAILGVQKGKEKGDEVAMTATTEFCNVVQTPLEKIDTLKHESFKGSTLYKQQAAQRKGLKVSAEKRKALGLVEEQNVGNVKDIEDDVGNLAEESLDLSCASGLAYLRARSQIGGDQESHRNRKSDNRPLEMSTLDGDIKLEYRDDFGRVQTPKEAFRAISWKFHGKVPGRKNMERRLLRLENEMKLKSMNPMESLPTLRALRHVQVADAKPYMVLSGANEK